MHATVVPHLEKNEITEIERASHDFFFLPAAKNNIMTRRATFLLFTAVRASYYGDSAASVYDAQCQCTFNCQYCTVPSLLSNTLKSASNRVICESPLGAPPLDPAAQTWATLTADGANGYCKTPTGYGEYMTINAATQEACETICAQAAACMAYEWSTSKCELHADMPTTVQAVQATQDVLCRVKTPPPASQPLVDSPCCPTFEAQLKSVSDYGFSLRVRPSPWVPGRSVLLQLPELVINDPEVRVSLERASYVGMGNGQGGVAAPPPPAAPEVEDDGGAGPVDAGRRLSGSHHRSQDCLLCCIEVTVTKLVCLDPCRPVLHRNFSSPSSSL